MLQQHLQLPAALAAGTAVQADPVLCHATATPEGSNACSTNLRIAGQL
jgi:hypothetical protein